jgi:pterin-4a-carbinolamine dehydratase
MIGHEPSRQELPPAGRGDPVDSAQLHQLLRDLPGWQLSPDGHRIGRRIAFPSAVSCLLFGYRLVELAAKAARVPFLHIKGQTLWVILGGHGGGGVAWADLALARRIDLGE